MGDFTVLPVYDGVGDWHFNRFRVVFKPPSHTNKQLLGREFANNFPKYFTSKYATVQKTDRTFATMSTFHFHGYKMVPVPDPAWLGLQAMEIDAAKPHSDWVVKIDDNDHLGFTAQTLKREFRDLSEDGPTTLAALAAPLVALAVANPDDLVPFASAGARTSQPRRAGDVMEANRQHFLAGRRSWRVDDGKNFGIEGDVMVFETAAVERFSHKMYVRADTVAGMEKAVPDIWIAMCNNFLKMNALVRADRVAELGWETKDGVDCYVKSFPTFERLASDPEFAKQKRQGLYRTLLPAR